MTTVYVFYPELAYLCILVTGGFDLLPIRFYFGLCLGITTNEILKTTTGNLLFANIIIYCYSGVVTQRLPYAAGTLLVF